MFSCVSKSLTNPVEYQSVFFHTINDTFVFSKSTDASLDIIHFIVELYQLSTMIFEQSCSLYISIWIVSFLTTLLSIVFSLSITHNLVIYHITVSYLAVTTNSHSLTVFHDINFGNSSLSSLSFDLVNNFKNIASCFFHNCNACIVFKF